MGGNAMNWYDNELCEICKAHAIPQMGWWETANQHCIDLRRNREARKHKNTKPKVSVF